MPAEGPKGAPLRVRPGMKFIAECKGVGPPRLRPLTDGRILCVQADVPPQIFHPDGRIEDVVLDVLPLLPPSDET